MKTELNKKIEKTVKLNEAVWLIFTEEKIKTGVPIKKQIELLVKHKLLTREA